MNLFFSTDVNNNQIRLDQDESKHCIKVLRLERNDIIQVTDGKGNLYEALISDLTRGIVTASIISVKESKRDKGFRLHIAIAPTKNSDRFEWFLEKAVEIGIDEISPVFCSRSERNRINSERLHKILISAAKQSLKTRLPSLNEGSPFEKFVNKPFAGLKLVASCLADKEKEIQNAYTKGQDVLVLIGPEGDFSDTEIDSALKSGFDPVSLGESRLRTETAGVYVTAVINLINRM